MLCMKKQVVSLLFKLGQAESRAGWTFWGRRSGWGLLFLTQAAGGAVALDGPLGHAQTELRGGQEARSLQGTQERVMGCLCPRSLVRDILSRIHEDLTHI